MLQDRPIASANFRAELISQLDDAHQLLADISRIPHTDKGGLIAELNYMGRDGNRFMFASRRVSN